MSSGGAVRMRSALGNAEFRALWAAEAQSIAGDQLAKVTLAILVYGRTSSALWAAAVYALTFLPALAGGLGLAQLADRYPRRTLLTRCAAIQAGLVGLMAVPGMPLSALCVLVVFVSTVAALVNATQQSLVREVFTDDDLYLRSQDLRGITNNAVMLLGLATAGVLVTFVGTSIALGIDAATFAITAVLVRSRVRWRPGTGATSAPWFGAARWVFTGSHTRILVALSWLVGLTIVPEGLAAPLADELAAGDSAVGWLLAADPVGFVVGAFVLSRFVSTERRQRIMTLLAVMSSAALLAFFAQPSLLLALVSLALAGAFGAYIITVGATLLTWASSDTRAGVAGVYRTGLRVTQGVGVALGGALAELIDSASTAIGIAGAVGVLAAASIAVSRARLQRANSEITVAHDGTSVRRT